MTPVTIELVRVGPIEHEDKRTVEWMINGNKHVIKVEDVPEGRKKYDGPMAEADNILTAEASFDETATMTPVTIELVRVGPIEHEDKRTVEWMVNGNKHVIKVEDVP